MTGAGTVTVDKRLVRYLRNGVKQEMGASVFEILMQLDKQAVDPSMFRAVLACFDDSRSLFECVGFVEECPAKDLVIDLTRWPSLVLRVLEAQYSIERARIDDARAAKIPIPDRDVPQLGVLVAEIRRKTGASRKRRRRYRTFLEEQLAKRRNKRRRGDQ